MSTEQAFKIIRQASTGCMVLRDGTLITPAMYRKAERVMQAAAK